MNIYKIIYNDTMIQLYNTIYNDTIICNDIKLHKNLKQIINKL